MDNKKEFINLLKMGDNEAFTQLVNQYSRRLFTYAVSLSGEYSFAKDIVQEVFLKTFEFREKLNPDYLIEGFFTEVPTINLSILTTKINHYSKFMMNI